MIEPEALHPHVGFELDLLEVAARLEVVGAKWRPLTASEARRLMTPPEVDESFEVGVARRLDELQALLELTRHLRGAQASRASKAGRLP